MQSLAIFMMAQAPAAPGAAQPNPILSMMPLVLMFGVLYFLMIRPLQKKAKEHKEMLEDVPKRDKVVTAGGICGLVANVKDDVITIKIADNVKVDFIKTSITQVEKGKELVEA